MLRMRLRASDANSIGAAMKSSRRHFLNTVFSLPVTALASTLRVNTARAQTALPAHTPPENIARPRASTGLRLLHGFIQPTVQRFHQAAHTVLARVTHRCNAAAAGHAVAQQPLRDAFRELVLAWSALELLRFGPLVQGNRFERIFFWPDPRGVMLRQLRPLLQSAENVPQDLRTHSVALQGLPALEYLLYGAGGLLAEPGKTQDGAQGTVPDTHAARCALALAVARNLTQMAEELQVAWADRGTYARDFSAPGETNAIYRNENETLAEVIKALSAGLRFEGEVKLRAALGAQQDTARTRILPFWRSDLSLSALAASVEALQAWHALAEFSRQPAWLAQGLERELQESTALLRQHHAQAVRMAQDPEVYQALRLAVLKLDNARRMVDENLAPALGVGLGFNALDGD